MEDPPQGEVPQQDPLGLSYRAHISQELQEMGLLEFVEQVHFDRISDAPGAGDIGLPGSARHGASGPSQVGHNNPPPPPTQPIDIHHGQLTNQAADMATARACQVLHLAKVSLAQLMTSYNPRAAGSGGTDGSSKRRKTSRGADAGSSRSGSKGLRHFSMKVCEKVEAKGRTTYNEVADELVAEMSKMEAATKNGQYDEKNIRRRVYDAINVLMAMDIIQKEKKEITWKGFPQLGNHSLEKLKADRLNRIREVEQKQLYLQDMIEQQKALKKLLDRSAARGPNPSGTQLFLPFILVQAKPDATVEVKISEDMLDVQFDFYDSPFQIHDDSHVLKKMAEHQARQQQQQPFGNPVAAGLGLPWQGANGAAGNLLAAALSPMTDPAAALAVAAAQAQAQGSALAYGYNPAAAAALYQHQQQQLLQHHQQQQQQQQQQTGQQQPGQQQQQHPHTASQAGQQQPGTGQQQQQQAAQQGSGQQQQQQPQQQGGGPSQAGGGPAGASAVPPSHLAAQHTHLQSQQLQTLQVLQAQLQQQQLQAQLHFQAQARGQALPGGLTLAAVMAGPLAAQQVQMQAGGQLPPQGQPGAAGQSQQPQQLSSAPQLVAAVPAGGPSVAAVGSAAAGGGAGGAPAVIQAPALPVALLGTQGAHHLGLSQLPQLSHAPQLGALLPLAHLPPSMAAALAPTQQQQQQGGGASAAAPSGAAQQPAPGSAVTSSVAQLPAGVQAPAAAAQHGMQLAGPAAATAFPLVA